MFGHLSIHLLIQNLQLKLGPVVLRLCNDNKISHFLGADPALTNESVKQTDCVAVLTANSSLEPVSETEQEDSSRIVKSV